MMSNFQMSRMLCSFQMAYIEMVLCCAARCGEFNAPFYARNIVF